MATVQNSLKLVVYSVSKLSLLHKGASVFKNTILIMSLSFMISHCFLDQSQTLHHGLESWTISAFLSSSHIQLPSSLHAPSFTSFLCVPGMLRATHVFPSASFFSSSPSNKGPIILQISAWRYFFKETSLTGLMSSLHIHRASHISPVLFPPKFTHMGR